MTTRKLQSKSVGQNQALIIVANSITNPTNTNPNLTNSTYPPPHSFSPTLVSRILPIATPVSPHLTKCHVPLYSFAFVCYLRLHVTNLAI